MRTVCIHRSHAPLHEVGRTLANLEQQSPKENVSLDNSVREDLLVLGRQQQRHHPRPSIFPVQHQSRLRDLCPCAAESIMTCPVLDMLSAVIPTL